MGIKHLNIAQMMVGQLDLMILEVFSNLNGSMILNILTSVASPKALWMWRTETWCLKASEVR